MFLFDNLNLIYFLLGSKSGGKTKVGINGMLCRYLSVSHLLFYVPVVSSVVTPVHNCCLQGFAT